MILLRAAGMAVLTPWPRKLLRAMAKQGPLAMREVARRVGGDVEGVHGDRHAALVVFSTSEIVLNSSALDFHKFD